MGITLWLPENACIQVQAENLRLGIVRLLVSVKAFRKLTKSEMNCPQGSLLHAGSRYLIESANASAAVRCATIVFLFSLPVVGRWCGMSVLMLFQQIKLKRG